MPRTGVNGDNIPKKNLSFAFDCEKGLGRVSAIKHVVSTSFSHELLPEHASSSPFQPLPLSEPPTIPSLPLLLLQCSSFTAERRDRASQAAAAAPAAGGDAEEDGINARTGRKQRVAREGGREGGTEWEEVERQHT